MRRWTAAVGAVLACSALPPALTACGEGDDNEFEQRESVEPVTFVADVRAAINAVEDKLGSGQEFFEVTANEQFTNVFVAIDNATATVPFLYVDGELQPPAPVRRGAAGAIFTADDVVFDSELLLAGVSAELPNTSIDAVSVYGGEMGAVFVLGATSPVGGELDIVVGPTGVIISVAPI